MAVTGFWPVKGSLKSVIDYADNPDKTTSKDYLDNDLYAALRYAVNDDKTDKQVYVGGINCSRDHAYEEMTAVQKHFGNRGKVVAYHGIQSFAKGEVTPEEAFEIGKETARAMWGDKYQVLVTVHLNTDNVHCHFVVNPVSFVDGNKFRNKIGDHLELRKVSDRICAEHGKSVIENSRFYGGDKKAYWIHKDGGKIHRDQLKEDVEYCLSVSFDFRGFRLQLKSLGYEIDTVRMSVKAKGWQRAVRLSNIGYTDEVLERRLRENINNPDIFAIWNGHLPHKPKVFPLENELKKLEFSLQHAYDPATIMVDTLFLLLITAMMIVDELTGVIFLSPDLRHEARNMERYIADLHLIQSESIHTIPELKASIEKDKEEIARLEHLRSKADNRKRWDKSEKTKAAAREERKAITGHIAPIRKRLKQKERILEKTPYIYELLQQEHSMERNALQRAREREYYR